MIKKIMFMAGVVMFSACQSQMRENTNNISGNIAASGQKVLVVLGSNFTDPIASVSTILLDANKALNTAIATTNGSDVYVKSFGNLVFVINRFGSDSIQVFDAGDNFKNLGNYSVGNGSNPQDIVLVGDKVYISRLDSQNDANDKDDVLILNYLTGEKLGGLDLKPYMTQDSDILARAARMALAGDVLYIACQDLSSLFDADTNGKVIVVDTRTNTIIGSIELFGRNPADIFYFGGADKIFVSDAGVFDSVTYTTDVATPYGGIEVINLATNQSEGIKLDDEALGGEVSEIEVSSVGYVLTSSVNLASFNPTSYEIINTTIYSSHGFYVPDIELTDNGEIILTERDATNPGIVFIGADGSVVSGPINIGALPASIAIAEVE